MNGPPVFSLHAWVCNAGMKAAGWARILRQIMLTATVFVNTVKQSCVQWRHCSAVRFERVAAANGAGCPNFRPDDEVIEYRRIEPILPNANQLRPAEAVRVNHHDHRRAGHYLLLEQIWWRLVVDGVVTRLVVSGRWRAVARDPNRAGGGVP